MADEEVPYQQSAQIDQLLAERENAVAYEQTDRVAAVDKQLDGLGYKGAAKKRAAAAEGEKDKAPEGRSSRGRQTTDKG